MFDYTDQNGRRWYRGPKDPQRHALQAYRGALSKVATMARRVPDHAKAAYWEGIEPFREQAKAAYAALNSNDPIRIADELHGFQKLAASVIGDESRPRQHWSRPLDWRGMYYRGQEALEQSDGESVEILGELLEGIDPGLVQQLAA